MVGDEAVCLQAGRVGDALENHRELVAAGVQHAAFHQISQASAAPAFLAHVCLPLAPLRQRTSLSVQHSSLFSHTRGAIG